MLDLLRESLALDHFLDQKESSVRWVPVILVALNQKLEVVLGSSVAHGGLAHGLKVIYRTPQIIHLIKSYIFKDFYLIGLFVFLIFGDMRSFVPLKFLFKILKIQIGLSSFH